MRPFVVFGVVLLFAMAIGAGVILARRRSTQQDSLLWILAIAAEGNMPLAPTVAAFADQYRGNYRRRIMNLAAELRQRPLGARGARERSQGRLA